MLRRERELVRFGGEFDGRSHPIDPVRGPSSRRANAASRKERACRVVDAGAR
jgi:hypothetical protein